MKTLAVLAVLFAVTQTSVPATWKATNNSTADSHTQNKRTDSGKNPAAGLVPPHTKEGDGPALKPDANKDAADLNQAAINITNPPPMPVAWGLREWAIWGANLALAIVGIGGIVVAICTLCFIKRQAIEMRRQRITMEKTLNAIRQQATLMEEQSDILKSSVAVAKESADSAEKSAEAAINLLPDANGKMRAYITLKNWGRVPSLITDMKMRFHTFGIEGASQPIVPLPDMPTYDPEQVILDLGSHGVILAPDQSLTIVQDFDEDAGIMTKENALLVYAKKKRLVCYGLVTYGDGFGQSRFTQFCHMWDRGYDPAGVIPSFRRLGPDYYNQAT
jgi:hypothetical protein